MNMTEESSSSAVEIQTTRIPHQLEQKTWKTDWTIKICFMTAEKIKFNFTQR